jgi:hypothetical protein
MEMEKPAGEGRYAGLPTGRGDSLATGSCAASWAHIPVKSLPLYQKFFDLCAPK